MSRSERMAWDERYRARDRAERAPDPLLTQLEEYAELLPARGRALDVACGAGRNAVWLAEKGWDVTACDSSLEGLRKAQDLARQRGVGLNLVCLDLESPPPWRDRFDLIIGFFYLDRKLFPWLKTALRPGGIIVYKTYTIDQLRLPGRPRHRMHLLEQRELLDHFRDFRVLLYQETVRERGIAQIVAQKLAT